MSEARERVCANCGCIESAETEMVMVNGEWYCEDCKDELFIECEECGSLHPIDDSTTVTTSSRGESQWCPTCVSRFAFRCDSCGDFLDSRRFDSYDVEVGYHEELWCEACAEDTIICNDCDTRVPDGEAYWVEGIQEYVCERCIGDYARCDECEEYFRPDQTYTDSDEYHTVCHSCAESSYYWNYCPICGEYVHDSDWDEDAEACFSCIRESRRSRNARVRNYHNDEPPMKYFGKYDPNRFKGVGTELEVDCRDRNPKKQKCLNELDELFEGHAYYKHDGSLNYGFEIVTQPHTVEEFFKLPWKDVLRTCSENGFSSHEVGTCGLHMHVSRLMFGDDEDTQNENIAKLMQFYEIYWDDILKVSRRTAENAERWASRYKKVRKERLKEYAGRKAYGISRYMAVNVTNPHTIEIRINRGTLKYETFVATCDFIITTVKNSLSIDWADVSNDYLWLKGVKKETLDYIQSRWAFDDAVGELLKEFYMKQGNADEVVDELHDDFPFDELFF